MADSEPAGRSVLSRAFVGLARPDRPVVAVLGDSSTLYAVQALWSAAHYGIGVLAIVLANSRYAIMDQLAQTASGVDTPLRTPRRGRPSTPSVSAGSPRPSAVRAGWSRTIAN